MEKNKSLKTVFLSTLYLSAFTFGGGYIIVSLLKSKYVDQLEWITKSEMMDLAAIAQSSPGAIAVNAAVVVGYKTFGMIGALVSLLGTVVPPLLIISVISLFYTWFKTNLIVSLILKGMQAGVSALIIKVIIDMGSDALNEDKKFALSIIIGSLIMALVFKINIMYIILILIILGIIFSAIKRRKNAL